MHFCMRRNRLNCLISVLTRSNIFHNFKECFFHRGVTQNCIIFTRPCWCKRNCYRPAQIDMHSTFPCHHSQSPWQVVQLWPPNPLQWGINLPPSPSVFKHGGSSILTLLFMVSCGCLWLLTSFYYMLQYSLWRTLSTSTLITQVHRPSSVTTSSVSSMEPRRWPADKSRVGPCECLQGQN